MLNPSMDRYGTLTLASDILERCMQGETTFNVNYGLLL